MIYRKDKSPNTTIKNILYLLGYNKINVKWNFFKFSNCFYSCRVYLRDYPLIGTNGKGLSRELALASGLAEFMERLQSFNLIKPSFCGTPLYINDLLTKKVDDSNIFTNNSNYLKLKKFLPQYYNECITYKNMVTNDLLNIPYLYINSTCGTNGLCAGNTYHEAISQGICEIFERFCIKKYFSKPHTINTIDIESLRNYEIYKLITFLQEKEFQILIKDLSFNIFPVVGVVLFNKEENYIFAAGCDVDINIAIQRCLTEIFQGLTTKNYHLKFQNFSDNPYTSENFLKMVKNNTAKINKSILSGALVSVNSLPFSSVKTNKESFDLLINIIEKHNYSVYYKDYSILGFNTYHVYIPELSSINDFNLSRLCDKIFLKEVMFKSGYILNCNIDKFFKIMNNTNFNRCGTFFGTNNMFSATINDINSLGFSTIISNKYNKQKGKEYNINYADCPLPNYNNCGKCKLRKKCYYGKWKKYLNQLKYIKEHSQN